MATDLGKVAMRMRGSWSSSATYEVLDAVTYSNGLYIAKQAVPANTAPTNTTYWQAAAKNPKVNYTGMVNLFNTSVAADASTYQSVPITGDGIVCISEIYGAVVGSAATDAPYFIFRINGKTVFTTQAFPFNNARASGASFPVVSGDTLTFQVINQNLAKCKIDFCPYA